MVIPSDASDLKGLYQGSGRRLCGRSFRKHKKSRITGGFPGKRESSMGF